MFLMYPTSSSCLSFPYWTFTGIDLVGINAPCHEKIFMPYANNLDSILTDKRNATTKNQSCFIQAVILSNYVEINQQKILAEWCFEGISNFVQRYRQTGVNQGHNLTLRMSSLISNFQKSGIH